MSAGRRGGRAGRAYLRDRDAEVRREAGHDLVEEGERLGAAGRKGGGDAGCHCGRLDGRHDCGAVGRREV